VDHVTLDESPFAPGRGPARIRVRRWGRGKPVVLLHGGWGYEAYPFDRQAEALALRFRVLAPDRTGYGQSGRLPDLPQDFHRLAAEETLRVLDALRIREAALWGHSDGAVVAAWTALLQPQRVRGLILEAFHHLKAKERSVEFFQTGADAPERLGEELSRTLEADHGADWRKVVRMGAHAWLRIIAEGRSGERDLHQGRLGEIRAPVLVLHGERDPRTEPGEIDALRRALPAARIHLLDAGHSPHNGRRTAEACTLLAAAFLDEVWAGR
jgi:pimeloyl-ACP methyl ester carboxylesterase